MKSVSIFLLVALSTIAVVHCEMPESVQNILLDIFNTERSSVSPPAANMRELRWCSCLAGVAENYHASCPEIGAKNPNLQEEAREAGCEAVDVGIGEVLIEIPPGVDHHGYDLIETMKAKCTACTGGEGTCDDECEGYHQVINAESYSVGCAGGHEDECDERESIIIVCYFSVVTNPDGPYVEGEQCSGCEGEWSECNDAGLCTETESPTGEPTRPHHNHHNHGHHDNHNHPSKPPKSDIPLNHGHGHKSHDHNHGTKHDHAHNNENNGNTNEVISVGRFASSSSSSASINKIAMLLLIVSLSALLISSL